MKLVTIIPCLNEELTIQKVVEDCKKHLPQSKVYVFDNGSSDQTANKAATAGAEVIYSPLRGKGNVLRQAFRLIEADFYIMVDGDGTYPIDKAPELLKRAQKFKYEMVAGARLQSAKPEAFRPLHFLGNHLFTTAIQWLFGHPVQDALTGMRVFSRRFVQEVQLVSNGFEVETELTIRSIVQNLAFLEVSIPYEERPKGSRSKLRTFRDGWRILQTIIGLVKVFRPLFFFSFLSLFSLTTSLACSVIPSIESLSVYLGGLSAIFLGLGFYLDSHLQFHKLRLDKSKSEPSEDEDSEDDSNSGILFKKVS